MKKFLVFAVALAFFSCNSNNNSSSKEDTPDIASNLELAKYSIDKILEEADYWENQPDSLIMAPYGTKWSIQLDSLKTKMTEKEIQEFNEYARKKFDEKYSQS
ncbi:hypothetical protein [Salinimicrobium sp. WS361]|uniref:hypothetical protein n=1 Tax=Salinimicrobium sp. WS361 TaxID=3425123 RepID=UPI003D6F0945